MQLLPRDEKFFDLLVEQAALVREASGLVMKGMSSAPAQGAAAKTAEAVRALERKGTDALRDINHRLHKTFITPVDPEDIHQLATYLDEVLDKLDAVAYRFDAFGISDNPRDLADISTLVHGCVEAMCDAVETLRHEGVKKPDELTAKCEEINRRALDTENRVRDAVRALFASEHDPVALIKQKEVCELLESTGDCCERVSAVLENIAVKNS